MLGKRRAREPHARCLAAQGGCTQTRMYPDADVPRLQGWQRPGPHGTHIATQHRVYGIRRPSTPADPRLRAVPDAEAVRGAASPHSRPLRGTDDPLRAHPTHAGQHQPDMPCDDVRNHGLDRSRQAAACHAIASGGWDGGDSMRDRSDGPCPVRDVGRVPIAVMPAVRRIRQRPDGKGKRPQPLRRITPRYSAITTERTSCV